MMPPELSAELWLAVFQYCDKSALLKLNRVTKAIHALSQPLIYRDVDLSIHNSKGMFPPDLIFSKREPGLYEKFCQKLELLQNTQGLFLDTLIQNPEYALYIRTFTWTLTFGSEWENGWDTAEITSLNRPHDQTWQVLLNLEMVQYLDLCSHHYLMRHAYVRDCPDALFPAATSIRLSGAMDQRLVHSIISHHVERIEELKIDDVQHWGRHADGRPLTDEYPTITQHRMYEPGIYSHGPIRDIFQPTMIYSNLKHLFLRKATPLFESRHWDDEANIAVYVEWAWLIVSVKQHLQHMVFEQAASSKGWVKSAGRWRPGNQWFHEHLLPVFLEDGWTQLKKLELRGVGRWHDADLYGISEPEKAAIAEALGPNVQVIVEEEAERPAWLYIRPGY